ncbi:hypothetical protein C8Q77DRAFT_1072359 [Trametes polyzona]|nr:hypothetical protein C8Q77DRAFT_1072359 [Trametes polyzona]
MSAQQMTPAQLATAAEHLLAAKMFSLASCVMLFYDIAITFGDEVEKIWKQRFTGATVLWFLNRYLSPLGYIVIIVSFHDPSWSKETCQRYVLYPEVLKIFTATAVGIIFILRLYSIYSKKSIILYGFGTLLVCMLAVKIWAFTDGTMLELPPDSVVFFATLYRTIQLYRRTLIGEALSLITVIMRDGIMYFAAIFVSNLVTVLIFIFATPDLKVINASFSTLITSLMVSRLMLNLRSEVLRRGPVMRGSSGERYGMHASGMEEYQLTAAGDISGKTFESSIIGNLGAPIITFERPGYEDEYGLYDDADDDRSDVHPRGGSDGGSAESGRRGSDGDEPRGELTKTPSLTTVAPPHPLPKLLAKRRPRTADDAHRRGDDADHTRSLPGHLVVQVTEEVVVVDEAPDHALAAARARLPSLPSFTRQPPPPQPSPPTSPLTPLSPRPPSTPRSSSTPRSPQSPQSPHSFQAPPSSPLTPQSPDSAHSQSLRAPRAPAYPSRPPHSAPGASTSPSSYPYPPPSPSSPRAPGSDSSLVHGNGYGYGGARPPRSWVAPPSWRLSLDKDREQRRHGQSPSAS